MVNCLRRILGCTVLAVALVRPECAFSDGRRPFTVKDSIEMTTFSDPYTRLVGAQCNRSPNGRYFFLVTTRGVIRTNHLLSTLWVYSALEVDRYLHAQDGAPPKPHPLLRIAGIPVVPQTNSYGSLIAKAQWSGDSRSIFSLVERPGGRRHIFRTSVADGKSIDLSIGNLDVVNFAEDGGTIAFLVAEHRLSGKVIGQPIDKVSSDLTGLSSFHIFFPKAFPDSSSVRPVLDLWVRYRGVNRMINVGGKWHFPAAAAGLPLAVSPEGRALIAAWPIPAIPRKWFQYRSASNSFSFDRASTFTGRSGASAEWPWQYIYVDLDKRTITPLVDAPSGFIAGYLDVVGAAWSPDSRAVIFTNSYLPLSNSPGKQNTEEISACAAAIYTTAARAAACIAYARPPKETKWLRSATFGASSSEAVLHWSADGKQDTQVYSRGLQGWILEPEKTITDELKPELTLCIRQDINEPPTLWAMNAKLQLLKELWNPNPQLASLQLGKASIDTWQDSTGYEWHAGLLLPPNFVPGHRYPLVIQTHGFSNEHEFLVDGSFTTGFAARPLAAAGVIVLQMEDRADRYTRPAQQEALSEVLGFESAIDHLDKDDLIDPSRVGIIGFSRAAWYVEEALIHAPQRFRAATLIDGIDQSYLTYMLFGPDDPEGTLEAEAANGGKALGQGLQSWVKNAAGFNLDRVRAPVRIEALGLTSVLAEWEIYSSLFQQGKPVDFIYIPHGQHILQKPQERYASQQGNVDWFRFWLQGYEDPDPAKKDMYERWRRWSHSTAD